MTNVRLANLIWEANNSSQNEVSLFDIIMDVVDDN